MARKERETETLKSACVTNRCLDQLGHAAITFIFVLSQISAHHICSSFPWEWTVRRLSELMFPQSHRICQALNSSHFCPLLPKKTARKQAPKKLSRRDENGCMIRFLSVRVQEKKYPKDHRAHPVCAHIFDFWLLCFISMCWSFR